MNKIRYIIVLALLLQFKCVVLSQPVDNRHNIAFWGLGGYDNILNDADNIQSKGGVGFGLGVGYEWNRKNFILQTGLEYVFANSVMQMKNFVHEVDLVDTEGDVYLGKFYFSENKDRYSLGYLHVPLMLGYRFNKFYFLAGGKLGMNLSGKSIVESTVKSTGDYAHLVGEFEDMPKHFFDVKNEEEKYKVLLKTNYILSAEIGRFFYPKQEKNMNTTYRFSLFFDYGLANIRNDFYSESLILNKSTYPYYRPVLNTFARSNELKDNFMNSIFVGMKFSILIRLRGKPDCRCAWE